jgi:glutamate transport system permease protein
MLIIGIWFALGPSEGTHAYWSVVIGLWLYNGSVLAEIFRAGINALPKGQSEAAYALGLRKTAVMRLILLPQAVKIMLPAIISQSIVALKDTSLGYAVLAPGLTYAGKQVYGEFQNIIQTALVMAAVNILCNLMLTWLATWAQQRFAGERKIVVNVAGVTTT